MDVLAPGGDLIIVSDCSEGLGSREYAEAQRRLVANGAHAFLQSIQHKPFADIDEWQTQMQTRPMLRGNITLVTQGLPQHLWPLTGVHVSTSLDAAVRQSLRRNREQYVAVIPEGPYVIPVYEPHQAGCSNSPSADRPNAP